MTSVGSRVNGFFLDCILFLTKALSLRMFIDYRLQLATPALHNFSYC